MSALYNPYTEELVDRLMALSHDDSRTWFALIRDCLRRTHGIDSLHDFVIGCAALEDDARAVRYHTLSRICEALKTNDQTILTAPTSTNEVHS